MLIPKHERRFSGFDDKIVAMYARGMTMREIQGFLLESYGVEVSPEFISSVTDAVMKEVTAWQSRPLEVMYPVVFFDALRVKIKEDAVVRNKAIYLALGVLPDGCGDILIAVTDGLKGMPEALATVYPATTLQTCIVHLIRNSLDYATWKDRKLLAAALRPIYTAASAEAAEAALDAFERGMWGKKFPTVAAAWRRAWSHVIPFFAFPPQIRRVIYTTNAICVHQRAAAQDHQDTRPLSERRCGVQADLAGAQKHHSRLGSRRAQLEGGDEPVRDTL